MDLSRGLGDVYKRQLPSQPRQLPTIATYQNAQQVPSSQI
jgi:hypothetical protein